MRNPKKDPQSGDVIRWIDSRDRVWITVVSFRSQRVCWADVSDNGYSDTECAHVDEWLNHAGIQAGTVLFAAPSPENPS